MDYTQQMLEQGMRLELLIKALNFKGKTFAMDIGVSQPLISRVCAGKAELTHFLLNKIINKHSSVNTHWLLTGEGDMMLHKKEPTVNQVNEDRTEYNRTSKEGDGPLESFMNLLKDQERIIKEHERRIKALEQKG